MDFRLGIDICQEDDNCQPGCQCPNGTREQNGQCVNEKDCYCYDEYGNTVLENFETKTHGLCQRWWVEIWNFFSLDNKYQGNVELKGTCSKERSWTVCILCHFIVQVTKTF